MSFHHIQQTERMRLPLSCPRQPIGDVRKPTQSRPSGNRLWSGVSGNQGTSQRNPTKGIPCAPQNLPGKDLGIGGAMHFSR